MMGLKWFQRRQGIEGRITGHGVQRQWCWWGFELEVAYDTLAPTARKLAGFLGGYWQQLGCTVGWVGLGYDEEPILASYASRQDLLAQRFLTATVENPTHTFPQLWCVLAPGVYLAQVFDPFRKPSVETENLLALVDQGLASEVLYLEPEFLKRCFSFSGVWVQPRGRREALVGALRQLILPSSR